MRAAYYEEPSGGFMRLPGGALIAALLGGGAFFGGQMGGAAACDGVCGIVEPVAGFFRDGLPMTDDAVSWGLAGSIAAGLGLLFALTADPRRKGLAIVSVLALAIFGLMLAGGRGAEIAGDVIEQTPLADVLPTPEPARRQTVGRAQTCPDGLYPDAGACRTCFVIETAYTDAALSLTPLPTQAAWGYAEDDAFAAYQRMRAGVARSAGPIIGKPAHYTPLKNLMLGGEVAVGGGVLCAADAALVLGSASSDGPLDRNRARARRRAERLTAEVRRQCPGLPVFAASLGQSRASADAAADRAITVLAIESANGEVTPAAVEAELGHALATGLGEAPLLERLSYFDDEWVWVSGADGGFRPEARSRTTVERQVLRDGAPMSCRAPS